MLIHSSTTALVDPDGHLRDVPGLRRGPHRLGPGRQLRASQPAGVRREDRAVHRGQRSLRGLRRLHPRLLRVAWAFLQGPTTGHAASRAAARCGPNLRYSLFNTLRLAGTAGVIGIGIGLCLRRRRRQAARQRASTASSTPRRSSSAVDPAVRVGGHPAARLRRRSCGDAAPGGGCLPARSPGFRPVADGQAHGAARLRRRDPDHRRLHPVHAGVVARRVVGRLPPNRRAQGHHRAPGARPTHHPQRADPDRHGRRHRHRGACSAA